MMKRVDLNAGLNSNLYDMTTIKTRLSPMYDSNEAS